VFIETAKTQAKLAQLLHEHDGCGHLDETGQGLDNCWHQARYMAQARAMIAKLMPALATEVFPQVRADERDKVAYHIVAELVCCDIHPRLEAEAAKGNWNDKIHQYVMPQSWVDLHRSDENHPMCRYGGWAASLAYHGPELDKRHEGWREGILFMPEKP
jgi:hypothetical protein